MAANPDNEKSETTPHVVRIGIPSPTGTVLVDPADLPDDLRAQLVEGLRAGGLPADMPADVKAALGEALGVDLTDVPVAPDQVENDEDGASDAAASAHGDGCTCGTRRREEVWAILDRAFPTQPHLWQAAEALFSLSSMNPNEMSDDFRLSALSAASIHIQHHAELTTPVSSSIDQLVEQFREQLDN